LWRNVIVTPDTCSTGFDFGCQRFDRCFITTVLTANFVELWPILCFVNHVACHAVIGEHQFFQLISLRMHLLCEA